MLLHGGMRAREKQEAMSAFAAGEADVLVATSVIEVGIDIPNATAMLIENADRFGISQLHQLRGRVGRGEHDSLCFLLSSDGAQSSARLRALADHSDGFRLAEIDLEPAQRGRARRDPPVRGSAATAWRELPDDAAAARAGAPPRRD